MMDGIAHIARQQQSQLSTENSSAHTTQRAQSQPQEVNIVKEMQQSDANSTKINSKEDVEKLVDQLNQTMAPMNTDLKFGVDRDDIFFVSVIESKTNRMIRRFPAEQAADFLPKMKEVTGILFDSKG